MLTNHLRCRFWLPAASPFLSLIFPTPSPAVPHCLLSAPLLQSFLLYPKWSPPPSLPRPSAWPTTLPLKPSSKHSRTPVEPISLQRTPSACMKKPVRGHRAIRSALPFRLPWVPDHVPYGWSGGRGANTDLGDVRGLGGGECGSQPFLDHTSQITGAVSSFLQPQPS